MKKTQILSLVVVLVLALTVVLAACQPAAPAGDALEEVKTAGKTEIDNYAKNFAQSDYTADGWTALQKAVTDGKAAVDAATNAEGVFTAVNNAKSAMDKVAKAPAATSEYVAYGLVHGNGYVGKATVTVDANGVVTDATLDEACLPTYVTAEEPVEGVTTTDKVTSHGSEVTKHFYTTVKFGGNTFTYSTTEHDYVMEGTTLKAWLEDEANAMVYFLSVYNNQVAIVNAEGEDDFTVMTSAKLFKSQNGYWSTPSGSQLGWKTNVEKTVEYVINNGFAQEEFTADNKLSSGVIVDDNGISTGATWTDFNDYYQLLKKAYETQLSIGSFNYYIQAWSSNYGVQVAVTVEDGIITDIVVLNDAVTGWHQITPSWDTNGSKAELQAEFVESLIGLSVEEIYDMTAAFSVTSGTSVAPGGEGSVSAVGGNDVMTGATQSEARLLLAIWNALLGL